MERLGGSTCSLIDNGAEVFAYKAPMVATAVGGIPEQVENGVTGFLVPQKDAGTMAACIEQLPTDVELRHIRFK